jgi:hypothetical protein
MLQWHIGDGVEKTKCQECEIQFRSKGCLLNAMSEILISSPGLVLVTLIIVFLENNGLLKSSVGIDWETGGAKTCVFSRLEFYKTSDHLGSEHFDPLLNPC